MTKRARCLIWGGLVAVLVLGVIGWREYRRLEESVARRGCSVNLRQLGHATLMYAEAHRGVLPDSIDALYRFFPDDLSPDVRRCYLSSLPFVVRTPTPLAKDLRPDDVLAYEPEDAHAGRGLNVLFGDGRVEWVTDVPAFRRAMAASTRPTIPQSAFGPR